MPTNAEGTEVPNLRDETLEHIVWRDPDDLDFLAFDKLRHSDAEIDQFQRTIHEYTGAQPIVIDDANNIVAGRGSVEAGALLGIDRIPALRMSSLSADDIDHYIETLFRFGHYVGWTRKMVETDLQHLIKIDALLKAAADEAASKAR